MGKTLTEMAAEIVAAQAAQSRLNPEELEEALGKTFSALNRLQQTEQAETGDAAPAVGAVPAGPVASKLEELRQHPKRSIRKNHVVCLECGAQFRQLTNGHLKEHGLTTREYRRKYGFSARQPLSSQSLSAKRRKSAKDRNLGEKLKEARARKRAASGRSTGGATPLYPARERVYS